MWPLHSDKHRGQRRQLSAYVDGRLPPNERRALEQHLASCETCQRELAELRSVVALLRATPQAAVPRSFALREAPKREPQWLRYSAPLRYAAAATAVLLVAVIAGDLATRPSPAPVARTSNAAQASPQGDAGAASGAVTPEVSTQGSAVGGAAPVPAPAPAFSLAATAASSTPPKLAAQDKDTTAYATASNVEATPSAALPALQAKEITAFHAEEAAAPGKRAPWHWAEGLSGTVLGLLAALAVVQSLMRRKLRARNSG